MVIVVVLECYVPPTANVIRRLDLGLKSHPRDWRSPGSISRRLVYKASIVTITPRRRPSDARKTAYCTPVIVYTDIFYKACITEYLASSEFMLAM